VAVEPQVGFATLRAACGAELGPRTWHFQNPEHARAAVAQGSRLLPCPYCAKELGIELK